MGGSSGNIFCFEKMEFKGMKNEFGEINVGVGRRGGHNYCPEATRKDLGGCVSVGYDQNFPSGLGIFEMSVVSYITGRQPLTA